MSEKPPIVVIRQSVREAVISDISTVVSLVAVIGIGVLLDSAAMQWIGAILGMLSVVSRASKVARRMSIAEARAFIDKLEAEATP